MMCDLLTQYGAVTIPLSILFAPLLHDWLERRAMRRFTRELQEHPEPEQ